MNKIILMGRLVADPETRMTQTNKQVTRFRLAVNRPGKPQEGDAAADFFNVSAWEKTAEFISKYFTKGQQVLVEGVIRNNNFTDSNQVTHYAMEVTAHQVYFAEGKRENNQGTREPATGSDGVGGQGYYPQPENAPEPWDRQAQPQTQGQQPPQQQQQAPPPQQAYRQPPAQQTPSFGPGPGAQQQAPVRQPWQK